MPRDRRYSTSAWQRTRKAILMRDGYTCQVRGPRCQHRATSVHHILPSSQYPHLFFDSTNLQASCGPCNYSGGRETQLANRSDRQMLNHYEQTIEQMQQEIDELTRRLEEHEQPRRRPTPAIR